MTTVCDFFFDLEEPVLKSFKNKNVIIPIKIEQFPHFITKSQHPFLNTCTYLTLSIVSNTSAAAPLAPNIDPRCGAAFPMENEPIITQKNTC